MAAHPACRTRGQWYDPLHYARALIPIVGADYPGQNWSYPPSMMLLMAPFGRLGYLPALAVWMLLEPRHLPSGRVALSR